jgi:hypothetical protein
MFACGIATPSSIHWSTILTHFGRKPPKLLTNNPANARACTRTHTRAHTHTYTYIHTRARTHACLARRLVRVVHATEEILHIEHGKKAEVARTQLQVALREADDLRRQLSETRAQLAALVAAGGGGGGGGPPPRGGGGIGGGMVTTWIGEAGWGSAAEPWVATSPQWRPPAQRWGRHPSPSPLQTHKKHPAGHLDCGILIRLKACELNYA